MKMYFRNLAEQRAVTWYKRCYPRGKWLERAVTDVAYDLSHQHVNWTQPDRRGFGMQSIPRSRWIYWNVAPYGHASMNQQHQLAQLCIRRNVFFPDMAKRMGRRAWDDPLGYKRVA